MGRLLLCKAPIARNPLKIEELDIRLYSIEELCYYIFHYTLLIEADFFTDTFFTFLEKECQMSQLSDKIKQWQNEGADVSRLLLLILQDTHYYDEIELRKFQEQLNLIRSVKPWQRLKGKGDYMLERGCVQRALAIYDDILTKDKSWEMTDEFKGMVLHNKAVAYTRLFAFKESAGCFLEAYKLNENEDTLKQLYELYLMEETAWVPDESFEGVSAEVLFKWKEEFELQKKHTRHSDLALKVRTICERDSYRRNRELKQLLQDWKKEYREMTK